MKKLSFAFALMLALVGGSAGAQTNLRVSHWLSPTAMPIPAFEKWLKSLEEASKGTLKLQIFPNSQLGRPNDHYDMARDAIADLSWSVPGFNAGRFPLFGASELPLIFTDPSEGIYAFDQWYRTRHASKEMPDVHYCMAVTGPVSGLHFTNKPVVSPSELRGLRMRPQNATSGHFFSGLGATIVSGAAAEVKQAADRGLLDGLAFPWRSLLNFGLQSNFKFHLDMPLTNGPSAWVMNKRAYDALRGDAKVAVDSHCTSEWSRRIAKEWVDWDAEGRPELVKLGHTMVIPNDEQKAQWRSAAEAAWDSWAKDATAKASVNGKSEFEELQKQLKARNAGG
jgi:TRAP-type C4-dicarboxylate transport system substrate-binding protein